MFKKKELDEETLKRKYRVLVSIMEDAGVNKPTGDIDMRVLYKNSSAIYDCCGGMIKEVNKLI